jgi:hypothetical protein
MRITTALVVSCAASASAFAGYTNAWDWNNCTRAIHLVPDARMNYDPRLVNVNFDPADVGAANIWDATKLAADAWNRSNGAAMNNNWRFTYGAVVPAGAAVITVRMGAVELVGGAQGNPVQDENGIRRFRRPPSVGAQNDGDAGGGGGGGGGGGATPALGLFQLLGAPVNGQYSMAEILFNPLASWATDGTAGRFNPVLLGMHELGHAMRLDHGGDGQMTQRPGPLGAFNGSVMRPEQDTGITEVNPFFNPQGVNVRYAPGMGDVNDATNSSGDCVPTPSTALTLGLACLIPMRRRRAA